MIIGGSSRPPGACPSRILDSFGAKTRSFEILGAKARSFECTGAGTCSFESPRHGASCSESFGATCVKTSRVCTDTPSPPLVGPCIKPCIDRQTEVVFLTRRGAMSGQDANDTQTIPISDFGDFFKESALGRFFHRVAMSVYIYICLSVCIYVPFSCNFFAWKSWCGSHSPLNVDHSTL